MDITCIDRITGRATPPSWYRKSRMYQDREVERWFPVGLHLIDRWGFYTYLYVRVFLRRPKLVYQYLTMADEKGYELNLWQALYVAFHLPPYRYRGKSNKKSNED